MQCSFRTLVFIYVLGGLTFVPLVLVAAVAFIYYTSPLASTDSPIKAIETERQAAKTGSHSGEELRDDDELEGVDAHKVGWLQVSREYDSSIGLIGPEKIPGNNRAKYMDKMRSLLDRQDTLGPNNTGFLKVKAAMFYAVLRHGNLFLYDSEEHLDVKHVIVLQHFATSLWPSYDDDDALFLKTTAICLSRKDTQNGLLNPKVDKGPQSSSELPHHAKPPDHSYFLFPTTNIEKEDWYFALLRGAKTIPSSTKSLNPTDPTIAAVPARPEPAHIFSLIQSIHSSDAQLQTRWLNALVGRIFLGVYRTRHMEELCIKKITKKIARVNRPAFLSDIKVQKVVVGTQAPVFTQPRLKELSATGEFSADVNVAYNGGFRIEIATVATLQLGSRFKPRQVSLSMAVTVKKLEGKLLVKIKKPPSNRLWVGFYEAPVMDLTIEPIVSSRQITYTMVLRAIENRIREAVEESIVLPNMDDHSFLPTTGAFYPGGIWERKDDEIEDPNDPAARGDVDAVEKEMQRAAGGDSIDKDELAENDESDSVDKLEPKRRLKTTLRSPAKETSVPSVASEQNLKSRPSRSQSFTSVSSAPAVVGTEIVNVAGTSPSRDSTDWAAEAAARAIAQKARVTDSPKLSTDSESVSRPDSLKSDSSLEDALQEDREKNSKDPGFAHLSLADRSASAPPSPVHDASSVEQSPSLQSPRMTSTFSLDREAALSTRVSHATGAAKEMLKTRLNTYLAKRQQSKLEKQILTKDRDLLVNSIKPRTRLLSDSSPNLVNKSEDEDIDSGPLPFENKKSPIFPPSEFSARSPGYGPSAMMTIPSTMANARSPTGGETSTTKLAPPALPPRSPPIKRPVPPPPLPARSSPRPIPRRPVPQPSHLSQSAESYSPSSSPDEHKLDEQPANANGQNEEDDLMILHIPSDDGEELTSGASSIKESGSSPQSPKRIQQVTLEEGAVLESASYGSSKSRRISVANTNESPPQWNEKHTSDRDMPEMMEEGLMG